MADKSFKCANCGGSSKKTLTHTQYKCEHCQTVYTIEQKPVDTQSSSMYIREEAEYKDEFSDKVGRTAGLIVCLLISVCIYAFFSAHKSGETTTERDARIKREVDQKIKETEAIEKRVLKRINAPAYNILYGSDTMTAPTDSLTLKTAE